MSEKLGQEKCISHNDEFQEQEQGFENKGLCSNCFEKINQKEVIHIQDSINSIKQLKQLIKEDRSNQLQTKLENINKLNEIVEQLRHFYIQQIEQISLQIKTWSQQLINEEELFMQKISQSELNDIPLFVKFIKEQQDVQIQDQAQMIKETKCLILNLIETDLIKKSQDHLESQFDKPIFYKFSDRKEQINIDQDLNLYCEVHNKQITLFDLGTERSSQKRIGCLECLDGTISQYTSIKRAQTMWQQMQQKKQEKLNNHFDIFTIKLNSIKEYFLALQKGFNCTIDNAILRLNSSYDEYTLKVNKMISQLIDKSWQFLTKDQIINIAQELSQINQFSISEDPLIDEYYMKENLVYEIARDTMKSIRECQKIYFEQVIHLINNQQDKDMTITLQYLQQSAKNIESQSTDFIEQIKARSINLAHKQQEQELSIHFNKDKNLMPNSSQMSSIMQSQLSEQKFKPFQYKLIENNSIKQNEFCRAIAFNQDCSLVIAGCNNIIKVYEFKQEQLKQIQILCEHQNDVHVLYFMKKSNQFISGSADKQILIWQINQNNQWFCQQRLNGHTHYIRCMILNESENLIISGSPDKTIKFWVKKNEWQCEQTITDHTSWVSGLSLNEKQNKLISSGGDKLILIIEQSQQHQKWAVKQKIIVEQYGDRLCFIKDDLFTFQPYSLEFMHVYKLNKQNQYSLLKDIPVKGGSSGDSYLFPQQYIKIKNLLINKNGYNINLLMQKGEDEFTIQQTIDFGTYYLFGQMSDDGQYLMTWDNKSTEIQIRRYTEL